MNGTTDTTEDELGTVPESNDFELLDDGAYAAVCTGLKSVPKLDIWLTGAEGEDKEQREWEYDLTEEGYEERRIKRWTSLSWHPKSNGFKDACALYARPLEPGEVIRRSKLVGAPCQLVIQQYTNAKGETKNTVKSVLPPKKSQGKPKTLEARMKEAREALGYSDEETRVRLCEALELPSMTDTRTYAELWKDYRDDRTRLVRVFEALAKARQSEDLPFPGDEEEAAAPAF